MLTIEKILLPPEQPFATEPLTLTPAQQSPADRLLDAMPAASIMLLRGANGSGRTTVLNYIQDRTGAHRIGMREFVDTLMLRRPDAIEQAFVEMIESAMADHDMILVDDFHLITGIANHYSYNRSGVLDAALEALVSGAAARSKKLIFATDEEDSPWPVESRAWPFDIEDFTSLDYESLCRAYLSARVVARLDFAKIHRFASKLTAHELKSACTWPSHGRELDTDLFIGYLSSINIESNVDIEEVQPVRFQDLKGLDEVIEALEAKIVLPFENAALAAELGLKPKRGVLLAGPPGTGKTTIGRALAHRLKGKFFLIDGTVIAGEDKFFCQVRGIFGRAIRNAPSVVFIDDTDLIFENNSAGFYRYLLTMLDGLESASNERVCVMMTAMEISSIPAAMVRSGRVELWLETRLPDLNARVSILQSRLGNVGADASVLGAASHGLTGADLKAIVEDGKLMLAYDKARGNKPRSVSTYFLEAIETVRANRRNYARKKAIRVTESVPCGFAG